MPPEAPPLEAISPSAPLYGPSSSTVGELELLPLSPDLLEYYRDRLRNTEGEMKGLLARIDATAATQALIWLDGAVGTTAGRAREG